MRRNPGAPYRIQTDDKEEFDELVVSGWFHLERMDRNTWWMRVGQRSFHVVVRDHETADMIEDAP